jgi:hypothetical protein
LEASGVDKEEFLKIVSQSKSDAEVEEWVKKHVHKTEKEIQAFNEKVLTRGRHSETFPTRKAEYGFNNRKDIQTFVDLIDADEGRL